MKDHPGKKSPLFPDHGAGGVAQFVECRTGTPLTQLPFFQCGKGFFLPRVNFQCRLSFGVRTSLCAIACIKRFRACWRFCSPCQSSVEYGNTQTASSTVGWIARPSHRWLSLGKATRISHGRNPNGTIQLQKIKKSYRPIYLCKWTHVQRPSLILIPFF